MFSHTPNRTVHFSLRLFGVYGSSHTPQPFSLFFLLQFHDSHPRGRKSLHVKIGNGFGFRVSMRICEKATIKASVKNDLCGWLFSHKVSPERDFFYGRRKRKLKIICAASTKTEMHAQTIDLLNILRPWGKREMSL